MESRWPQGARESKIRGNRPGWSGWSAMVKVPQKGRVSSRIKGITKGQGQKKKKIGVVAGASGRKPEFKIHGHQQDRKQGNWREQHSQAWLGPTPVPREHACPSGDQTSLEGGFTGFLKGGINKENLVPSFFRKPVNTDNFKQTQNRTAY